MLQRPHVPLGEHVSIPSPQLPRACVIGSSLHFRWVPPVHPVGDPVSLAPSDPFDEPSIGGGEVSAAESLASRFEPSDLAASLPSGPPSVAPAAESRSRASTP